MGPGGSPGPPLGFRRAAAKLPETDIELAELTAVRDTLPRWKGDVIATCESAECTVPLVIDGHHKRVS